MEQIDNEAAGAVMVGGEWRAKNGSGAATASVTICEERIEIAITQSGQDANNTAIGTLVLTRESAWNLAERLDAVATRAGNTHERE